MQLGFGESQMLDKLLYEEEVRRCVFTFEQQFHYGVFYAYMRLREQEVCVTANPQQGQEGSAMACVAADGHVQLGHHNMLPPLAAAAGAQHHVDCRVCSTRPEVSYQ
jgi:hypothetical protein